MSIGTPDGSTDAANPDSSGASDAAPDSSQASDTGADSSAACPDEHGSYTVALSGTGCGDTDTKAPQCIMQSGCKASFSSMGSTAGKALNGDPAIQDDGSFSGAAITEGTVMRSGCVGVWNGATSTLTVVCGGDGGGQSCTATLTRNSMNCN